MGKVKDNRHCNILCTVSNILKCRKLAKAHNQQVYNLCAHSIAPEGVPHARGGFSKLWGLNLNCEPRGTQKKSFGYFRVSLGILVPKKFWVPSDDPFFLHLGTFGYNFVYFWVRSVHCVPYNINILILNMYVNVLI